MKLGQGKGKRRWPTAKVHRCQQRLSAMGHLPIFVFRPGKAVFLTLVALIGAYFALDQLMATERVLSWVSGAPGVLVVSYLIYLLYVIFG